MVELSSLDVRALAQELRALEDAYVDKVYQTAEDTFVLKLRHPETGPAHLLVRVGQYVARTREPPATPETPTSLALALRKHLSSARIRRVDQHEFDRVLRIHLERGGEPLELVLELFGKGNLLLAGADGKIIIAWRSETFAHRTIKRGEALVFPPPRVNPLTMARSEFERLSEASEKDVVRFLALDLALGGELAEEVAHRAGVEKGVKSGRLDAEARERLWTRLREILDVRAQPGVVATVRGWQVETVPFQAPLFRDAQREPAASLSDAVLRVVAQEEARVVPAADVELERLRRQVQHQERGMKELEVEAARWERRGHLLFANYAAAAEAIQKAKASIEASSWLTLADRVKAKTADGDSWLRTVARVDPKRARVVLQLEDDEVPIDPFASLEHNAAALYDESKRIRAKAESAKVALADARRRIAEREANAAPAPAAKSKLRAPTKRFWFEGHRWFYTSEGFLVVAGRDATANEKLVKRHLSTGDRYAHADIHGAPSTIVKSEGRVPGEASLKEACLFAATFSRAFSQFEAADAYWVHPEQVSKTAESGEYVPKGAFVIRGTRNYMGKSKLEAALGILTLNAHGKPAAEAAPHRRLVSGPLAALKHYTPRIVRIERGTLKPSDAAKEIAPIFGVTLDEVIAALPPGNVRIAERPEGHG